MKKEDISYAIVGIIAGLAIGFLVANRVTPAGSAGPAAQPSAPPQASVNSSSQQELPPGHPPVDPSQPVQAGPLPAGTENAPVSPNPSSPASGDEEVSELPSLDPLPASSREKRAEQEYKNIQMLRGLPAERVTKVMFAFKNSLGVDCTYCHVKDHFEKDDKAAKQVARKMIALTRDANAKLGGAGRVTCFTCHRGQARPPAF